MTATWISLPEPVQVAVERFIGPVAGTADITGGRSSDIAVVLRRQSGQPVFLKGVNGISRRMRWLRNEIIAGKLADGIAPVVLFHADVDGWLVVGFEYVPGRPASLVPGSPDLPLVAAAVEKISAVRAPGLRSLRDRWSVTDWWTKIAVEAPTVVAGWDVDEMSRWSALVPELVDGDRLVHTDLHGDQFVIGAGNEVHVIDWGFPGAGAAWVDTAFLTLRLIEAGNSAAGAEEWAGAQRTGAGVDHETITAFAVYVAGLWSYWAVTDTIPGAAHRARLARDYASWRLALTRSAR